MPRRGDTHDEANEDGYSRLDDGDVHSFWKSNPYLDQRYTGIAGEHADWIVIELPHAQTIDTIDILWAAPFARRFEVQYWVGADPYEGHWITFPRGSVTEGQGGRMTMRLSSKAIRTSFVRVLMTQSSHSAAPGSTDPRDALGYAVSEIQLGRSSASGHLIDLVHHAVDPKQQTIIHVSSTDPWHRAIDRDTETAQPSPTALRHAGVVGQRPIMMPLGVLYDSPDNMVALLDQLQREGVPIDRVELGEEPDGQLVSAEDYGALYVEFAQRIHARFPRVRLGGPSLVNGISDTWLDPSSDESWTSHFVRYLKDRQALGLLSFFSFEYFPFDDVCGSASSQLRSQTTQLEEMYKRLRQDQVPANIPWLVTEFGYSAFGGAPLVQMPSALVTADAVGGILQHGGQSIYIYGQTPDQPIAGPRRCAGQGNLMFWLSDRTGKAVLPMPSLRALTMLTHDWTSTAGGQSTLFASRSSLSDARGRPWVTSYPVRGSGGRRSILLVNRAEHDMPVDFDFDQLSDRKETVDVVQYSAKQYRWNAPDAKGRPQRDVAPVHRRIGAWARHLILPPLSIVVVAGV